jgi:hypothetical protein
MRVTTELWVSAITRRAFASGGFAAIARRGSPEAGAVMVTQRNRLGETRLFAPAPQTSYGDARPEERYFSEVLRSTDLDAIAARIDREARFDPDLWVLDLEVDEALLADLVPVTTP